MPLTTCLILNALIQKGLRRSWSTNWVVAWTDIECPDSKGIKTASASLRGIGPNLILNALIQKGLRRQFLGSHGRRCLILNALIQKGLRLWRWHGWRGNNTDIECPDSKGIKTRIR